MRHPPAHNRDPFDQVDSSDDCPVQPLALSSGTARPVRWLWPGRIPLGKLTILDGDPGLGKSDLLLDLAAPALPGHARMSIRYPAATA